MKTCNEKRWKGGGDCQRGGGKQGYKIQGEGPSEKKWYNFKGNKKRWSYLISRK